VSNGVIATVPVISPGSGYTSAPTIAVSGTGGGSGAVVAPMMSGPGPGDVVTYSAPAGWLATAAGNVPAASGAPVANYAGMLDPWVAQAPRTMPIGMNITSGDGAHGPLGINQNWMTGIQANFIGASQPMSSIGPAYYTASVTHGSATVTFAGVEAGLTGSLVYFPGDTSGNLYTVTGGSGTSWTISPAFGGSSLSGVQCLASPAGSIVIYPAAGDTTGQYAQGIAAVDGSGSIASIAISNPGFGYTLPPNVYIPPPASGGTQATATAGLAGVMGMNVGRRRRPLFGTTAVSGGSVASIVVTAGGSGYCGSTSDGHPIAINGASNPIGGSTSGVPTAYATVAWVQSENSGIGGQVPDQAGTWTFVADESSPSSPMVVTLYSGAGGLDTGPLPGTIVRGTVTGGVEVGKTWSFDVARDGSLGLDLMLCVQGPTASASAPWTLSNEYLTPPRRGTGTANVPDRTAPMAPDPNVTAWLSLPGGVGPAVVRPFPFGALSWGGTAVDPSDLRSTSDFTWWDGPQRNINVVVTAIRAYQTSPGTYSWSSPYVFTSQEYPNTQSSAGIPGAPLPYYWAPANANWIAGYLGGSTDWIAAECVTATPHGLKTGMRITLPSNPILAALQFYDAGSASVVTKDIAGYKTTIFVTGASSFVFCPYTATVASSPSNANITTVYGSVTTPFPMTFLPPVGTQCMPYEAVARMAAALPDCGVWVDVPTSGTDACIAAVAARTRDNTPVGVPVYVEYMNEHWNTNFIDYFNLIVLSNLCAGGATGIAAGNQDQMYAYRASEVHDIFAAVFDEPDANGVAGRGGSIVRVMGSQWTSTASVDAIVAYANAYNTANPSAPIRIDAVCVAPYPDAAQDSAWGSLAAAAYSNYPGSVSYQGNPVLLGTYIDLMKNQIAASAAGGTTASVGNLAAYNTVAGQGAPPQLVCYEASIQSGVADNLSTTDYYLRAWIAHDIYFHPWFRDVETAFEVGCQQAGVALAVNFNACQARTNDPTGGIYELVQGKEDDDGTILWGYTTWEGMTWGLGDGSADGNGDATVNQTVQATGAFQDLANVSPKLQGWRDWAAAANAPPARSTPPARRWFPGLARRPRPAGGR
jgi:hypothetical protein